MQSASIEENHCVIQPTGQQYDTLLNALANYYVTGNFGLMKKQQGNKIISKSS
jgi:hypothetical protein